MSIGSEDWGLRAALPVHSLLGFEPDIKAYARAFITDEVDDHLRVAGPPMVMSREAPLSHVDLFFARVREANGKPYVVVHCSNDDLDMIRRWNEMAMAKKVVH